MASLCCLQLAQHVVCARLGKIDVMTVINHKPNSKAPDCRCPFGILIFYEVEIVAMS
jgi:hypothetical protein